MSLWLSLDVQQTQTPSPFVAAAISQRKDSLASPGCQTFLHVAAPSNFPLIWRGYLLIRTLGLLSPIRLCV